MLAMNSDYKRKQSEILKRFGYKRGVEAIEGDSPDQSVLDEAAQALDALLLEVVFKLVDQMDNDYPQNSEARRALHTLYSKAEELINPKEEV